MDGQKHVYASFCRREVKIIGKTMKTVFILFLASISGCAVIAGKNNGSNFVQFTDAAQIAKNYLVMKNIAWGEPTSVSESSMHYIFIYYTPEQEGKFIGGRMLNVDKATGEVYIPPRM